MTPKALLGDLLGGPKIVQKVVLAQDRTITKNSSTQFGKKTILGPPSVHPLPHVSDPKRFFSQTSQFFYTSFFEWIFGVICKHQKKSTERLSPARELDFHCSTKSSKYIENAFIFDPKSNL